MAIAELISKSLSYYTLWQLCCPSYYLHMTVVWEYETGGQLRGCCASSCPWWNGNRFSVSKLNLQGSFQGSIKRSDIMQCLLPSVFTDFCLLLWFCVWIVGWMCFPPAWTPWAPSRQQTLTAWRSSSSIMTSTTAGIWQQRPTGIMKTVRHASLSARESRLLQVCYTSGLTNVQYDLLYIRADDWLMSFPKVEIFVFCLLREQYQAHWSPGILGTPTHTRYCTKYNSQKKQIFVNIILF